MREYTVKDKHDQITFVGERIGHASTRKKTSLRWTEISIYRTEKGNYVVETLGRSVVYHRVDETCATGEQITGYQIGADSEPCETCDPDIPEDIEFNALGLFVHEVTRSQGSYVDAPQKVREAMLRKNPKTGKEGLSWVASEALRVAGLVDPVLRKHSGVDIRVD